MKLPKPKKIKLINEKEFAKLAKAVRKDFEEQAVRLHEQRVKDGHYLSFDTDSTH